MKYKILKHKTIDCYGMITDGMLYRNHPYSPPQLFPSEVDKKTLSEYWISFAHGDDSLDSYDLIDVELTIL